MAVKPKRALIARISFLFISSFIEKIDCMYFIAFGFNRSLGLFPENIIEGKAQELSMHTAADFNWCNTLNHIAKPQKL